jgi:hypothetical protein
LGPTGLRQARVAAVQVSRRTLRQAAIAASTLRFYSRVLDEFEQFARSRRLPLSGARLVNSMERFFWHCADHGLSPAIKRAALYGWLYLRRGRPTFKANNLKGPRGTLGWAKLATDHPRALTPEEILLQINRAILHRGKSRTAAAVIVALHTYGWPGEVVNNYADDVILRLIGTDRVLEEGPYIYLSPPCTSFSRLFADRVPCERILGDLPLSGFATAVKAAVCRLGYKYFAIGPLTFRSGPSNDMCHKRRKLSEIQKRGRWKNVRPSARYEKSGRPVRLWGRLTPSL